VSIKLHSHCSLFVLPGGEREPGGQFIQTLRFSNVPSPQIKLFTEVITANNNKIYTKSYFFERKYLLL